MGAGVWDILTLPLTFAKEQVWFYPEGLSLVGRMPPLHPGHFRELGLKCSTSKLNIFLSCGAYVAPGLFWDFILPISLPMYKWEMSLPILSPLQVS